MVSKIPLNGLRKNDIRNMLDAGKHVSIIVVHEIMLDESFRVLVDTGAMERYTLYTYRGDIKRFATLGYVYKFCQDLGIPEFKVRVKMNKDGV